jgi:hypothetical protein
MKLQRNSTFKKVGRLNRNGSILSARTKGSIHGNNEQRENEEMHIYFVVDGQLQRQKRVRGPS